MSGLATDLLRGVGAALSDLERAVRDVAGWRDLLSELGWDPVPLPPSIAAIATPAGEVVAAIAALERGVTPASIDRARTAVVAVVDAIDGLSSLDLGATGLGADLAAATFDHLVIAWLAREHPLLYAGLIVAGLIEVHYLHEPARRGFHRRRLRWDNLGRVLDRPAAAWTVAFGWGGDAFDAESWTEAIADLIGATGIDTAVEILPAEVAAQLTAAGAAPATTIGCTVRLLDAVTPTGSTEVGGRIVAVTSAGVGGIALVPIVRGAASTAIALRQGLELDVSAGAAADGGGVVVIRADGVASAAAMAGLSGGVRIALRWTFGPQPLATIDGTRGLWASGTELGATIAATSNGLDVGLELGLIDGRVRTSAADGDGFVAAVVPDVDAAVTATLGWSNRSGLHFRGSGGLELDVPVGRQIGPARIDDVRLVLAGRGDGVGIRAGVAASIALGPVTASIAGLGIDIVVERGTPPRLLGAFDVRAAPAWPSSIGLAIDSPAVSGSGFLEIDEAAHRYAGAVEIRFFNSLELSAIGIVDTVLPDGSKGFSLLFLIDTIFPRPIFLGYNFYLEGVGGMLGLHRSIDLDRLRNDLRNGAAQNILFPRDVAANMTAIISQLEGIFPPKRDQFIIGPMARITWSVPPLIVIDLGLIIEFNNPMRVAVLGLMRAAVPDQDDPIVDIKVAFLGAIDFQLGLLSFDASIYDSYIGRGDFRFSFEGDIAVRLSWGQKKDALSSIGGFHPAYTAPAYLRVPKLRRITLSLLKDNPRLRLTSYFAVTTNTVQFGAELDFYFGVSGLSVVGDFGFDVLFQFDPFRFIASVKARVAVRSGSTDLFSLSLTFDLQGTTPWTAKGDAKFSILFFSFTVHFEKTWGERIDISAPAIAILPAVLDEFRRDVNWKATLSDTATQLVQLFPPAEVSGALLVDAAGVLEISQTLVPLGAELKRFNNARPSDISSVNVFELRISGSAVPRAELGDVSEEFAPQAFRDLSDKDKLAAASYEPMKGGVAAAGGKALATDYVIGRPITYENIVDDGTPNVPPTRKKAAGTAPLFTSLVRGGAVGASPLSRRVAVRRQRNSVRNVSAKEETFSVVSTADLTAVDAASRGLSRSQAQDRIAKLVAAGRAAADIDMIPGLSGEVRKAMAASIAQYTFIPWLRQGLASKIPDADTLGGGNGAVLRRASLPVDLTLQSTPITGNPSASPAISKSIQLLGPGDIRGIRPEAIVRVHPRNGTKAFETGALAYVDFYEEDFPWRYTPARAATPTEPADRRFKLRPWIALLVLADDESTNAVQRPNLPPSIKLVAGKSQCGIAAANRDVGLGARADQLARREPHRGRRRDPCRSGQRDRAPHLASPSPRRPRLPRLSGSGL